MIKQILFDFGNVLVRFDPDHMTAPYVQDTADRALVAEVVFDRLYWRQLDAGTISDEEVVRAVRSRLPARLQDVAEETYRSWFRHLPETDGMDALLRELHRRYPLYLLSNISRGFAAYARNVPILRQFDACIFSAVCGHTKPNADMFSYACETLAILPEETLFIDDSPKNIAGAEAYGIRGYLFDGDVQRLRAYLNAL